MNVGKTLFAQVMEFVPWTSFARIVDRYSGNAGCAHAVVRRAVPRHGLRAADLAREPARHRGEPVGQCGQALRDGLSLRGQALDAGRCQRIARLAHLGRSGRGADPARAQALRQRLARRRVGQHRVRAGLHHHRSVPEPVRVGAVSLDQGRRQAAHAAGPARRDSRLHPHQRRQAARRQRAGHAGRRGRRLLRDGSRLSGLRAACTRCIRPAPSSSRAPSRRMDARRVYSATTDRSHGRDLRPARDAQRLSTRPRIIPSICGAFASRTPRPARRWSS